MAQTEHAIAYQGGSQIHVDHTPAAAVGAGDMVNYDGSMFGVANEPISANKQGSLDINGIYKFKKDGNAITAGNDLYWDTVNNEAQEGSPGAGNGYDKVIMALHDAAAGDDFVIGKLIPDVKSTAVA